ncbi:hypothetical protein PFISCL1PPCAC_22849 [Pristionchus fissidentatus]|uniref:Sodium/potassium-transporting ATPase subunit beta-3 n=1 Tax=Pristionchus fissidentatus TaxID=1538716 RepID=A0AAV5WI07_9BILA|nr:hypothetical protein PFISCL1PPCAC_22849 [Pristionchus fissidentatus]
MAKGNPIEEQNALMANGSKTTEGVEQPEGFAKFLYNKEKGTVMGRTAKSWMQITVFYIIFYTLLAGFWVGCLAIFLNTLDPKVPRFFGKGTIIGVNPGLGYQPWIKERPDSTMIKFNLKDADSYAPYVHQMESVLEKYANTNGTRVCVGTQSNADAAEGKTEESCKFSLDEFNNNGCSAKNGYGYKEGSPCVILSLNRLIGWRPTDYEKGSVPEQVQGRYKPGSIAIHCDGTNNPDKEHIGKLKYIPASGIDGKYYPYQVMDNYHQPIAMVKFESLPRNQVVLVECRAFAYNIEHDITARLGLVHFEVYLQDKDVVKTNA